MKSFVTGYHEVCGHHEDIQIESRTLTYQEINGFFETVLQKYGKQNRGGLRRVRRNLDGMANLMVEEGFTLTASAEEGINLIAQLKGIFIPRPGSNVDFIERHSLLDRIRGREPTYEISEYIVEL